MPNVGTRSGLTLHHQNIRRAKQDAFITRYSLQLVAEEFRKIFKPKIQKLKGRYSANTMLVFNSWLKEFGDMCKKAKTNKPGSSPTNKRLHNGKCKRCSRVLFGHQLYLGLSRTYRAPQKIVQIQ